MFAEHPFFRRSMQRAMLCVLLLSRGAGAQTPTTTDEDVELTSVGASVSEDGSQVQMKVGEQVVLDAAGVRSYSEGASGIIDVRLTRDASQFVLVGQQPGTTTLLFIMLDGRERLIQIEVVDPQAQARAPREGEVEQVDNVRLDFYFVQLDRSNRVQVGAAPPASVTAGTFAASFDFLSQSFQSATAVVEDQALLRLDMAQAAGWAKLSRKAALITENGKKATFSGGGEVNIPVQGSLTTGIHSIGFGSTIEVLPHYDAESGRLRVELSANVADLTDDRGSGAPGRVTSSIHTVVNLRLGQTVVLAGLSAESQQQSRTGIPVLSQLPVLGVLFGSQRRQLQSVDNVVFIVPTVINSTSAEARARVERALDAYDDYRGGQESRSEVQRSWEAPGAPGLPEKTP